MSDRIFHSVSVPTTAPAPAIDPLGLTAAAYADACAHAKLPGGRAGALDRFTRLFRDGQLTQPHLAAAIAPINRTHTSDSSEGTTLKFTQRVPGTDGSGKPLDTESVLIPMVGRKGVQTFTLCVSSQVGCAMGCVFCQTAQMGLIRSLTPAEIVGQWHAATHALKHTITNMVFMGMGEPLDNLHNVLQAIAVLTDHRGAAVPMNKIVISTVGRLDGLARLAEQIHKPGWHRLNLAVSLNAPTDEIRSRIMPINKAMPLRELRRVLEAWPIYGGSKICFEYVLIPGVNDQPEHARAAAAFVLGSAAGPDSPFSGPPLPGMLNLIPYNPRDNSPWPAPDEAAVDRFLHRLLDCNVLAKRRRTKGRDTMAACGQLGNPDLRRRPRAAAPVA